MKNSVKIFIVIICLIIVGVVTFFVSKNVMKKTDVIEESKTTNDTVNKDEKNDAANNTVNKDEKDDETNNTANKDEKDDKNNNTVDKDEKDDKNSQESDSHLTTDEDIVKELYLKKIQEEDSKDTEKLIDYRIDNVEIIKGTDKQGILDLDEGTNYKNTDILANVTFSVKPQDINSSSWLAGNGEIDNDWIVNKMVCVCVRDGKIISTGTSW